MKRKWKLWMIAFVLFVMTDIMMQSNRAEAKKRTFTVSPKTIPCSSSYRQKPYYNKKTKQYYMINSYMRRLSTTGGTLKLKKGTYYVQVAPKVKFGNKTYSSDVSTVASAYVYK